MASLKYIFNKIYSNEMSLSILIYIISLLIINPIGNFPINDDWIFYRQVEAFHHGIWKISALIDPSFIFQGMLGYIWSSIFGLSFTSLRFLTILVTILSIIGLYKTLLLFKVKKKFNLFFLLTFVFNPLIYSSSFTFMTDNYFLCLFIWSIYFYLSYLNFNDFKHLIYASSLAALSILIRQFGILILLAFLPVYKLKPSKDLKVLAMVIIPYFFSFLFLFLWPRYPVPIFKSFIAPQELGTALIRLLYALPYLSFFILPFAFARKDLKTNYVLVITAILIHNSLFSLDIFPAGNVFYIEELYSKFFYKTNLSIFDNILFTHLLSLLVSYGIAGLINFLFQNIAYIPYVNKNKIEFYREKLFFILLGALTLFSLVFVSDFYDRYLLPTFYCVLLFFALNSTKLYINKLSYFALTLIIVLSVFLQWEYFSQTKLRWKQAYMLSDSTGLVSQIFVDGVWDRYTLAQKNEDYSGLGDKVSVSNYKCYVQKYTLDTSNILLRAMEFLDKTLGKITFNPRIYNSKKLEISSAKNNLDKLIYNTEYFSPLYTLIGKKAYVGSWCTE